MDDVIPRSVSCKLWRGLAALSMLLAACATPEGTLGPPRKEFVWALTADQVLLRANAGQPGRVLARTTLSGLAAGERLVGIDFRVARGVLYGLSNVGRLYTIDTASGQLKQVGAAALATRLQGEHLGMDFNPAVDRIRIVTSAGQNLRAHPDTGLQIDGSPVMQGVQSDGSPRYEAGDAHAGRTPLLVAAAYTYNSENEKITTMFAIDAATGSLVRQGSQEGAQPFVSPDTGRLATVGALGDGPVVDASFDISDGPNTALLAARARAEGPTRLHWVDLGTGKATLLGVLGDGRTVVGLAIEP